jgi:hypothetical protein
MNAAIVSKSSGRLGEPTPFGGRPPAAAPAAPLPDEDARTEAEYGCVDWYQYRVPPRPNPTTH